MVVLTAGFGGLLLVKGYPVQSGLLLVAAVVGVMLMRRPLTYAGLGAAVALLMIFVNQHGVYFYRSTYRFDYRGAARQMVAARTEDLPIVVDDMRYPKQIAFYLETETGRPVLSSRLEEPEAYYFVTVPEGGDPKTGWVMERRSRGDRVPGEGTAP
jgi:hypothetical protein